MTAANWEYMFVETPAGFTEGNDLRVQLASLGSLGWEAVGYTCLVLMGPNVASVMLKRETLALPRPSTDAVGWYPDPSKRFELRHWDGLRWTQHVSNAGVTETDYPNIR